MDHSITADWVTLLNQASGTASGYMGEAIVRIDDRFGDGFAEAHPELIAAFMQAAASDFHAAAIGVAAQKIAQATERAGEAIGGAIIDALRDVSWEVRREMERTKE